MSASTKPKVVIKFGDDDTAIILALRGLIESESGEPHTLTEVTRVALREAFDSRTGANA